MLSDIRNTAVHHARDSRGTTRRSATASPNAAGKRILIHTGWSTSSDPETSRIPDPTTDQCEMAIVTATSTPTAASRRTPSRPTRGRVQPAGALPSTAVSRPHSRASGLRPTGSRVSALPSVPARAADAADVVMRQG